MTKHADRVTIIVEAGRFPAKRIFPAAYAPPCSRGYITDMKLLSKSSFLRGGLAVLLVFALLPLSGCEAASDAQTPSEIMLTAMDTVMTLTAYGSAAENALEEARGELLRLESLFSATKSGSDIGRINSVPTATTSVDPSTMELLEEALRLSALTDGALDITVYPLITAYGFPSKEYILPDDAEIDRLLELVGYEKVSLGSGTVSLERNGMALDLGAVAKGYASNRCAEILSEAGVTSALIKLGGNIQAVGSKPDGSPWRVAVQNPADASGYVGVIEVSGLAVVTSGSYERYFDVETDGAVRRIHHIIDPETGRPADNGLVSVTVVSEDGLLADAYSTALFVMGLEEACEFWREQGGFEALFVTDDGSVYITEGLEGSYSPSDSYPGYEIIIAWNLYSH